MGASERRPPLSAAELLARSGDTVAADVREEARGGPETRTCRAAFTF